MEELTEKLRQEIFLTMGRKDWSLQKTANVCGMSRRGLQNILDYRRRNFDIKLSTLLKIADGLGKPISAFVGGE